MKETKKSFFEYLSYSDRYKRLPTLQEEGKSIKKVVELVKLVEDNKALWTNDFGLTVPLIDKNAKTAILTRLTDHFDTLQPDTSRFVKEEYWLGVHGHEKVFGDADVYLDEYGKVVSSGRCDLLFRYYLLVKVTEQSKQSKREQVLEQLINNTGLDELKKLGRLEVWKKLSGMNKEIFPPRIQVDSTIKGFFSKQNSIKFR